MRPENRRICPMLNYVLSDYSVRSFGTLRKCDFRFEEIPVDTDVKSAFLELCKTPSNIETQAAAFRRPGAVTSDESLHEFVGGHIEPFSGDIFYRNDNSSCRTPSDSRIFSRFRLSFIPILFFSVPSYSVFQNMSAEPAPPFDLFFTFFLFRSRFIPVVCEIRRHKSALLQSNRDIDTCSRHIYRRYSRDYRELSREDVRQPRPQPAGPENQRRY